MGMRGTFSIPSIPGDSVAPARRAYRIAFGSEWICDDDFLRELAQEFRREGNVFQDRATCLDFIGVMRENDETAAS